MSRRKVIFTIGGLHPEFGGPSHSVPKLCGALAAAGAQIELVTLDYGDSWQKRAPVDATVTLTAADASNSFMQRLQWSPNFRPALHARCEAFHPEILHDTGLWLMNNHAAATTAQSLRLPRIVSPRGMLTGWALRHKGWKKRIAWLAYQRRDLRSAEVLHATSPTEVADIRAAGFKQPVALIPNGVQLPPVFPPRTRAADAPRTVLFLGRLHKVKGLFDLVQAWAALKPAGWRAVIAGHDDHGHLAAIQAAVRSAHLENHFSFVGPAEGDAKWSLYRQADIFVLPSHSENFGLVVAEALASCVPVITTTATPWAGVHDHRCGWCVEPGPIPLASALQLAFDLPDDSRGAMGNRGRLWMEQDFAWPALAARMLGVYDWMLGQGARPSCILA